MSNLLSEITVEQAQRVYEEKGVAVTMDNGEIKCEIECEDYCENC